MFLVSFQQVVDRIWEQTIPQAPKGGHSRQTNEFMFL